MRAYEGYFENGRFYPMEKTARMIGKRRAFLTVLDEPARDETIAKRLDALNAFFSEIDNCDETVAPFERVNFREIEI